MMANVVFKKVLSDGDVSFPQLVQLEELISPHMSPQVPHQWREANSWSLLYFRALQSIWSAQADINIFISACADHMDWSALKYRRLQLFASLHWCGTWGDMWGEISSSSCTSWGKETSPSLKTFLNTTFAIINSPSPDPLKGLVHLNVFVFHKVTSREQEWRWS